MTDHPSSWEVGRVQSGRARSWLWNNFFLMMRWTSIMRLYKKRTVNNFHISFFMKRLKLNSKKIKWMQPYISIKTESCYSSLRNWVVWKLFFLVFWIIQDHTSVFETGSLVCMPKLSLITWILRVLLLSTRFWWQRTEILEQIFSIFMWLDKV